MSRVLVAGGSPQALGLAVTLARAGWSAVLVEEDAHDLVRARDALARAGALDGITLTVDLTEGRGAALGIEAASAARRTELLAELEAIAAPGALLASVGPDAVAGSLAARLRDPARFVALDLASPPPEITMVEIVAAPQTAPETLDRAAALARTLGAEPLVTPRFIGAALIARLEDAVEGLVFEGAAPWEVDTALEAFGFDPGPCAAQDRRGLDIAYARHRAEDAAGTRHRPLPVLDRMVREGRLGRKGSVGWYRYPGGEGRVIDPLVEDLAREEAHFAGVAARDFADEDMRHRVLLALIDEAARLVAETGDAAALDRLSIHAAGFPANEGGLWSWAREYGLRRAVDELRALAAAEGPHWAPSPSLVALSA